MTCIKRKAITNVNNNVDKLEHSYIALRYRNTSENDLAD